MWDQPEWNTGSRDCWALSMGDMKSFTLDPLWTDFQSTQGLCSWCLWWFSCLSASLLLDSDIVQTKDPLWTRSFRPAWLNQGNLTVTTTGSCWNGGKSADLLAPLGQHMGCGDPDHQGVGQFPMRNGLTHRTAHDALYTNQSDLSSIHPSIQHLTMHNNENGVLSCKVFFLCTLSCCRKMSLFFNFCSGLSGQASV